jgi:hypothetical protein
LVPPFGRAPESRCDAVSRSLAAQEAAAETRTEFYDGRSIARRSPIAASARVRSSA